MNWFRKIFPGTQKGNEEIPGRDVSAEGKRSVAVGGDAGDILTGDQITGQKIELSQATVNNLQIGITSKELIEIFEKLFGKEDQRTNRVREQQEQMSKVMPQLLEWKEFHNRVNILLTSFGQFGSNIEHLKKTRVDLPDEILREKISAIKDLWRPIKRDVEDLLYWKDNKVKHIQEIDYWAGQIEASREDIDIHLATWEEISPEPKKWVNNLYEKKNVIEDAILHSMGFADDNLLETAQNLYDVIYRRKRDG